ncbi:alpha/beta hydrolase [Rhizobiales bacterium]|uniref:alpha/beta family hydrolase n=1 Tax=Hongsoonwoonella zoysiae TaxID=2821844 RepID=UPI0015614A05|nr:alpha/beta family hydrolase [Hongsoonwoonella zoysiae]NRG19651.1 alpha/beta hydrolase [Hongsoonwoonella zoysiae]
MTDFLWTRPQSAPVSTLLLAHGAGAAMDSAFMNRFCEAAAEKGILTARFEFAYMAARRSGGKEAPPPRAEKLVPEYQRAVQDLLADTEGQILIGGKSMGGRVAAMLCGSTSCPKRVSGLICLGYPFHPTGKPDQWRLEPLQENRRPALILQGERDPFGSKEEIRAIALPDLIGIDWLEDGNHDFGPRGKSPATWEGNIELAARKAGEFAQGIIRKG